MLSSFCIPDPISKYFHMNIPHITMFAVVLAYLKKEILLLLYLLHEEENATMLYTFYK